jgi:hypothetical protein
MSSNKTKLNKNVVLAAGLSLFTGIYVFTHHGAQKPEKPQTSGTKTDIHVMKKNHEEVTEGTLQYPEPDSIMKMVMRNFKKEQEEKQHSIDSALNKKAQPTPLE